MNQISRVGSACETPLWDLLSAGIPPNQVLDDTLYAGNMVSFGTKNLTLFWTPLLASQQIEIALIFDGPSISVGFGSAVTSSASTMSKVSFVIDNRGNNTSLTSMGKKDAVSISVSGNNVLATDAYSNGVSKPIADILFSGATNDLTFFLGTDTYGINNQTMVRLRRALSASDNQDLPLLDSKQTLFWSIPGNLWEGEFAGSLTTNFFFGSRPQPQSLSLSLSGVSVSSSASTQMVQALSKVLGVPTSRFEAGVINTTVPARMRVSVLPSVARPLEVALLFCYSFLTPCRHQQSPAVLSKMIFEEANDPGSMLRKEPIGRSIVSAEQYGK